MSTHNEHFHDKMRKFPLNIPKYLVFLSYGKNFLGTKKHVRISHGKLAIVIKVLLYVKKQI